MKTKKQIEEMESFIGYFNDGRFMNQDYRNGIKDALYFVTCDTDGDQLSMIRKAFLPKDDHLVKED